MLGVGGGGWWMWVFKGTFTRDKTHFCIGILFFRLRNSDIKFLSGNQSRDTVASRFLSLDNCLEIHKMKLQFCFNL